MSDAKTTREDEGQPGNFVADRVRADLAADAKQGRLVTRFPPEPNGYLHIGHAKSICLNFGLAALAPQGQCNLRFDDTNPEVESPEYVEAIRRDIRWLGFDWGDNEFYASDYFQQLYDWAEQLVEKGLAYVDSRSLEEIRETRGDFHRPGVDSPHRDRSVAENLDLLRKMKAGELPEGSAVLRAKIDMQSKDLKLRDPLMYRIKKVHHHRTGDAWNIYPMYDWAHGQSDAIEGVTYSVCSLEFVNHRPLYNWFLKALEIPNPPEQIEFGRLNLSYTVLSKRKLLQLVEEKHVAGWDDPRMPTVAGMRRRGFTPESIRAFADRIGVSKNDGVVDVGHLEYALREHLNETSPRVMGVLRPLELVITNWPEGKVFEAELDNLPGNESAGTRKVPFGGRVFVEQDDFLEEAPKKWWRLAPGNEVRLRGAALVTVNEVVKDDAGQVVQLKCTWDPASEGGNAADGRKVRGTIHWVSAEHAVDAEVRLYDRLFADEDPSKDFLDALNPDSLEVLTGCKLEPSVGAMEPGTRVQLERIGYFVTDSEDHQPGGPAVLNRTITLKDSWAKLAKKMGVGGK
ncbi:MAG: glutamine--tRNA ligase [Sandaracinus sp.]|nr:glutamine--tRNA ligase [Sandaracinus sp.]|tara:strand:- start:4190 stop:5902 length:1713 start_codon:yes stop_codon:yes gene_type:complete